MSKDEVTKALNDITSLSGCVCLGSSSVYIDDEYIEAVRVAKRFRDAFYELEDNIKDHIQTVKTEDAFVQEVYEMGQNHILEIVQSMIKEIESNG